MRSKMLITPIIKNIKNALKAKGFEGGIRGSTSFYNSQGLNAATRTKDIPPHEFPHCVLTGAFGRPPSRIPSQSRSILPLGATSVTSPVHRIIHINLILLYAKF